MYSSSTLKLGDVPEAWLVHVEGKWIRMRPHEQTRLAKARCAGTLKVPLDGGRSEARLWPQSGNDNQWAGESLPCFHEAPPTLLACSRWCFKLEGQWQPFGSADNVNLEERLQEMLRMQQISPGLERLVAAQQADVAASAEAIYAGGVAQAGAFASAAAAAMAAAAVAGGSLRPSTGVVVADGRFSVLLSKDGKGGVTAEMRSTDKTWLGALPLFSSCSIARGWAGASLPALSEDECRVESAPPSALVLLVHGIGEALWRKGDNVLGLKTIEAGCDQLRALAARAAVAASVHGGASAHGGAITHGGASAHVASELRRVEILPVTWDTGVRSDRAAKEAVHTLSRITLSSTPLIRQFANEVLADVLLYEQAHHRLAIQRRVVARINEIHRAWQQHHPGFAGPVILCGHSLGSLITFDILHAQNEATAAAATSCDDQPSLAARSEALAATTAGANSCASGGGSHTGAAMGAAVSSAEGPGRLNCQISALVLLGSPVAFFVAVRGHRLGPTFSLRPSCARLFNVFARNDPVAYRLEPLLSPMEEEGPSTEGAADGGGGHGWARARKALDAQPRYVPHAGAGKGGMRLHIKLRQDLQGVVQQAQQAQLVASAAGKSVQMALSHPAESAKMAVSAAAESAKMAVTDSFNSMASLFGIDTLAEEAAAAGTHPTTSALDDNSGFAVNQGERVDWMLQESTLDAALEYTAALQAHTSYFDSQDLAAFLVNEVVAASVSDQWLGGSMPPPTS